MKSFGCAVFAVLSLVTVHAYDESFDSRCIRPCPDIYKPVCGYDGENFKVFANECEMEVNNCNFALKDERIFTMSPMRFCQKEEDFPVSEVSKTGEKICNQICTANWDPICGFDGTEYHIFGNLCDLQMNNCLSNYKWSILKAGEC